MSEIEFRAWQTVTRVMFYHIEKGTGAPDGNPPFADYLENEHMVVMQYTGLKDKNGKKIFQGDLVQVEGYATGTVTYLKAVFAIVFPSGHKIALQDTTQEWIEVIGNTWEKE